MPVDVLHVVPAFYPTRGGIEVLVENLAQVLNEKSPLTHAVLAPRVDGERVDDFTFGATQVLSVDAPHPNKIRRHHEGLEQLPHEHAEFARILLKSRQHIQKVTPQLIHLHGLSLLGNAVSAVAQSLNIPVLMHIHGSVGGALSPRMKDQLLNSVKVVTVSEFVKASVASEVGRTEGVHVIRNGLPDARNLITQGLPNPLHQHITLVGRLEKAKGFDYALRDIALLKTEFPDLTVNIIGVGEEQESLKTLVDHCGLESNVMFHGRQERVKTLELVGQSTCVVVPSISYEGFSLVALESAQLERPVVASNVGGLPETVLDGVTGTIVDPLKERAIAEAVRNYLLDPELARVHGTQARERALTDFTMDRMAQEIHEVHTDVLGVAN